MSAEQMRTIGIGAALGIIVGVVIGAATDNTGLWVALGLVFGAGLASAIGAALQRMRSG